MAKHQCEHDVAGKHSLVSWQSYPLTKCNKVFLLSGMYSIWHYASLNILSTLHESTLISHIKLTPGWGLIQLNFDPIQNVSMLWEVSWGRAFVVRLQKLYNAATCGCREEGPRQTHTMPALKPSNFQCNLHRVFAWISLMYRSQWKPLVCVKPTLYYKSVMWNPYQ